MYVCLCFGKTDIDVKTAIKNGAHTLAELADAINVTAACGSCRFEVQRIIDKTICNVCGLEPNSCCGDDKSLLNLKIIDHE